jgi:type II secretion system protein J
VTRSNLVTPKAAKSFDAARPSTLLRVTDPRSAREAAFTLIEVLMAMTIFALVITAIYATWTIILKSRKIGGDAVAQVQRERITVHTIEQALMSARSFAADIDRYSFEVQNGESGSISFVAQLPDSFPRSGKFWPYDVRRVTFQIEPGQNYSERDLVLRQNPILMDLDEDEEKHPLVLARNVQQMLFEFWDGRKNEWSDSWAQSNTLPRLVRFTVAFARPNEHGYSHQKDEVTRLVGLPTGTVPQQYQGGRPPVGGANPPITRP